MRESTRRFVSLMIALVMVLQIIPTVPIAWATELSAGHITAEHTTNIENVDWDYQVEFSKDKEEDPTGALSAYWDKDNLYVGTEHTNASALVITVNGVSKEYTLDTNATSTIVTIPLSEVNVRLNDYNQCVDFNALLKSDAGSAEIADRELCFIVADTLIYDVLADSAALESGDFAGSKGSGTAVIDTADGTTSSYITKLTGDVVFPEDADILMTQMICVEEMPVTEAKFYGVENASSRARTSAANGYSYLMIDRTTNEGFAGNWGNTVSCTLHNVDDEGNLSLVVVTDIDAPEKDVVVPLGVQVGDTFKLDTYWRADNSVEIYVDGELKATVEDAVFLNNESMGSATQSCVWLKHKSLAAGTTKMTITNAAVYVPGYTSITQEITQEVISELVGNVEEVRNDISLPQYISSKYLGDVVITWESSLPSVIDSEGKVNRPMDADVEVVLTAKSGDVVLGSVKANVKKDIADLENPTISIYHTSDTISRKPVQFINTTDSALSGSITLEWDQNKLYAVITHENASTLTITINGVEKSVELDDTNELVEIPLPEVGINLIDFNSTATMQAVLTDSEGNTALIAEEAATLVFAIPEKEIYDVLADSAALESGDFAGSKGSGTAVIDTADGTTSSYITKLTGDVVFPEDADILMTQTICVEEMPVTEAKFYGTENASSRARTSAANGYSYLMIDRTTNEGFAGNWGNTVSCTLHNVDSEGNLSLVVVTDIDAPEKDVVVPLGVQVGDTFKLDTYWRADNSVEIYVDGELKATVEDAVFLNNESMGSATQSCVWLKHKSLTAGTTKITVTDVLVYQGGYTSITEEITQEDIEKLVGDLSQVRSDINLPTVVTSQYLGELPITWESSDATIISSTGEVTRPTESNIEVVLTASITGGKTLGSVTATVVKVATSQSDAIAAYYTNDLSAVTWKYTNGLNGANESFFGALGAYWDKENLYFGVNYENASTLTLTVNGVEYVEALEAGNTNAVITVPFQGVGVNSLDYNSSIPVQAVLSNGNDTASLGENAIDLFICINPTGSLYAFPARMNLVKNFVDANATGEYLFDTSTHGDSAVVGNYAMGMGLQNGVKHTTHNMHIQQTIQIETMPEGTYTYNGTSTAGGYSFYLGDRTNGDYHNNKSLHCTIINTGDENLTLFVADNSAAGYTAVDLGRKIGDKFVLGTQWNTDESLDIYVDGIYKTTIENVTRSVSGANNNLVLGYNRTSDLSDTIKLTISNVVIHNKVPVSIADELGLDSYFDAVNWNAVRNDIALPTSATSAYLGNITIDWTSSDEAVITSDGKVTRPASADVSVELTAAINESGVWNPDLGTYVATVKKALPSQNDLVEAWHSSDVDAIEWEYTNGMVGETEGMPSGGLAAFWDKDNLYIGVEFYDADTLTIDANGKTISVNLETGVSETENVSVSVDGAFAEITIPLSVIDLKLLDYNVVIDFEAVLSNSGTTENVASSCTENGKLQFLVDTITLRDFVLNSDFGTVKGFVTEANKATLEVPAEGAESYYMQSKYFSTIIDRSMNLLLEHTLTIDELPVTEAKFYGANTSDGYRFYMIEEATNPAGGGGTYGNMVLYTLHNVGEGELKLVVNGGTSENWHVVDLGVNVGDTFKLGTLWYTDGSVAVFVNDVELGKFDDVTYGAAYQGKDLVSMSYSSNVAGAAKITITDVSISRTGYSSIKEEATPSAVFAGMDLPVTVETDIDLPTSFESEFLGILPISWESSDTDYIGEDGTVTRPDSNNNVKVELTASISGGPELFKLTTTVKAGDTPSPTLIPAPFTESSVTLDGSIAEEGWSLNTAVIHEGIKKARFGVQWDLNNLYLAIDADSLDDAVLTINNVTVNMNETEKATANTITELIIPLQSLGITVSDYGVELPITFSIGEGRYTGTIRLTSIDWFSTDNSAHRITTLMNTSNGTSSQGVQKLEDGYYIYDHYNANGENPGNASSYVYFRYPKADTSKPTVVPLWPVDETYIFQFDFQATSMPVYSASDAGYDIRHSNYGVHWSISGHRETVSADGAADVVLFGMYNNGTNLMFVVSGEDALEIVPLDKKVGDLFRIGVAVDPDGNMTLFIDGEEYHSFSNAEKRLSALVTYNEDAAIFFNVVRNGVAPQSDADSFDVYMTNYSFGLYYGDEVLDSLTFDTIKGQNTDQFGIESNLELPNSIANDQLTTPVQIEWESSRPDVVSPDGTVTMPAKGGQLVTLTAKTPEGKSKEIQVYVNGVEASDSVMTVFRDTAPHKTPGVTNDVYEYTFDEENKSIINNLGAKQKINVVKLTDGDTVARLHPDVLKLYVSDDNVTYTQVEKFKLLHNGRNWYLYDFEAEAQYVKVHCTHYDGAEADFMGVLAEMISAYYDETLDKNGTVLSTSTEIAITNDSGITKNDSAWTISASEIGEVFASDSYADARFYLNGELLYHYFENGNFVVRVPKVNAGSTVTLTVKSGCDDAMDISNKEYVHEMVYGTREVWNPSEYTGNRTARTLTMSNGVVIGIDCRSDGRAMVQQFSYDGGQSWTAYEDIECSEEWIGNVSGFIYDSLNDRIYLYGYAQWTTPYTTRLIYTDDNGETWSRGFEIGTVGSAYVDGIELSTNDGAGPNVDFVIGLGSSKTDATGAHIGLQARVVYSKDGGETWLLSDSSISIDTAEAVENGISENSLIELPNGTIVMYTRWQAPDSYNFGISYSYDHGITWTETPVKSEVYTVNTNPVLMDYKGTPVLLWSGNSALGGTSYRRIPLSIAYSADLDELKSFENIQDLYARYSLQGLDTATQNQATNPHISYNGDDLLIHWFNNFIEVLYMRVENFDEYFYKTKGAYDSFEGRSPKYEGWSTLYGSVTRSAAEATDGTQSMKLAGDSAVARSIPYLQNGKIKMDLHLNSANANFTLYLQSAFSNDTVATPIALTCNNGSMVINGQTVNFNQGWNTVEIDITMSSGTGYISVNGNRVVLDIDSDIGTYICFVRIATNPDTTMYLDDFLVVDEDILSVPTSSGQGDVLDDFDVVNYANEAVVTGPARGWTQGSNTFTVYAQNACVVAVSNDGGQTYIRLQATTMDSEDTYSFTVDNVSADTKIIVMLKGDANADGKISVADRLILNRALMDENEPAYSALDTIAAVACDLNGDGVITVTDRLALNRALLDADNSAYVAPKWDE